MHLATISIVPQILQKLPGPAGNPSIENILMVPRTNYVSSLTNQCRPLICTR